MTTLWIWRLDDNASFLFLRLVYHHMTIDQIWSAEHDKQLIQSTLNNAVSCCFMIPSKSVIVLSTSAFSYNTSLTLSNTIFFIICGTLRCLFKMIVSRKWLIDLVVMVNIQVETETAERKLQNEILVFQTSTSIKVLHVFRSLPGRGFINKLILVSRRLLPQLLHLHHQRQATKCNQQFAWHLI